MNSTAASNPSELSETCVSFGYNGGHFQVTTGVIVGGILSSFLNAVGIVAGIPGNVLVILAIFLNRSLHHNSEFALLLLAVSDLLVSALLQPLMVARKIEVLLQRPSCATVQALQVIFCISGTGSFLSEMLVSVERTVAVLAPYWYEEKMSPMKLFAPPVCVWLVSSLVLNILFSSSFKKAAEIMTAILVGSCLLVTMVCYGLLVKVANKHENQIEAQQRQLQLSEEERKKLKRERKALWTAIYVNSAYLVSYIPAITGVLITATAAPAPAQNAFLLYVLAGTTVALPSVANPIILSWRNTRVGREMKKLLGISDGSSGAVWPAVQSPAPNQNVENA